MISTNSTLVILAVATILCIVAVWVVKSEYAEYFNKNYMVEPLITIIILVGSVFMYMKLTEGPTTCKSPKEEENQVHVN